MEKRARRIGEYAIVIAAVVIAFLGMRLAASLVGSLMLMLFFSIVCRPIYDWLCDRGLKSGIAIALVAVLLLGMVSLLVWIVIGSLNGLVTRIGDYAQMLSERADNWDSVLGRFGITELPRLLPSTGGAVTAALISLIGAVAGFVFTFFYIIVGVLFLILDGPAMWSAVRSRIGESQPLVARLNGFGAVAIRYFGLRTYLNAATGLLIGIVFLIMGVDFAALWAVLVFVLSYVPYIGLFVACAGPVLIVLAESGVGQAILVIVLITAINVLIENVAMPRTAGKAFSLSAFVIYFAFFFWTWLLGPAGALLSSFLTVLITLILDSYDESRWLAAVLAPNSLLAEPHGQPDTTETIEPAVQA